MVAKTNIVCLLFLWNKFNSSNIVGSNISKKKRKNQYFFEEDHILVFEISENKNEWLKEMRNCYFCVTPNIRHFMSLHYISPNNSKNTYLGHTLLTWTKQFLYFHARMITVVLSFVKTFTHSFQYFRNLRENQSTKVVFWKNCAFPLRHLAFKQLSIVFG